MADRGGVVARRVGPRQPPAALGDRITGLAADSHFAGALITLWHKVSQAGGAVGFAASAERSEVASAVTDAVNGLRAGSRHGVALTAGNDLIGVAFLVPRSAPVQRHLGEIRSLMVDPDYQGHGYGRRLVDEITALATEVGVATLLVGARDRQGLDTFYQGLGFEEYGRLSDSIRLPDGTHFDEILYRRAVISA